MRSALRGGESRRPHHVRQDTDSARRRPRFARKRGDQYVPWRRVRCADDKASRAAGWHARGPPSIRRDLATISLIRLPATCDLQPPAREGSEDATLAGRCACSPRHGWLGFSCDRRARNYGAARGACHVPTMHVCFRLSHASWPSRVQKVSAVVRNFGRHLIASQLSLAGIWLDCNAHTRPCRLRCLVCALVERPAAFANVGRPHKHRRGR